MKRPRYIWTALNQHPPHPVLIVVTNGCVPLSLRMLRQSHQYKQGVNLFPNYLWRIPQRFILKSGWCGIWWGRASAVCSVRAGASRAKDAAGKMPQQAGQPKRAKWRALSARILSGIVRASEVSCCILWQAFLQRLTFFFFFNGNTEILHGMCQPLWYPSKWCSICSPSDPVLLIYLGREKFK